MPPTVSVDRSLAASPEEVFAVVADPTAIAELSPELQGVRWLDGATGPELGARYRGVNRNGIFRWSTVSTITELDPPRTIAHDVGLLGRTFSRWRYDLEPDGDGTRITASTIDLRPGWFARVSVVGTGVADRTERNRQNLAATLDALAGRLEGAEGPR